MKRCFMRLLLFLGFALLGCSLALADEGLGILGDKVWRDANGNGIQDSWELGMPGVEVTLGEQQDSRCVLYERSDEPKTWDITTAEGTYWFPAAPSFPYCVFFKLPDGYVAFSPRFQGLFGADSNADSAGYSDFVTLVALSDDTVEDNRTIDAGLIPSGSLGNRVWFDSNPNGLQDTDEPGVAGVSVTLYDAVAGAQLGSTVTDSNGYYSFNDLAAGTYYVVFEKPATGYGGFTTRYVQGPDGDVPNDADSNADASGRTGLVELREIAARPGVVESNFSIDAGLLPEAAIGDRIWVDTNGNGVQDDGEPGKQGVAVSLEQYTVTPTGYQWSTIATTTSDENGKYYFGGLMAETYRVAFVAPTGYAFVPSGQGSDREDDSDASPVGVTPPVTLALGQKDMSVDAGLYHPPASVGDWVWEDLNGNGKQDGTEAGIAGVVVRLYKSGSPSSIASTLTDANGFYQFPNLSEGIYQVEFVLPTGYSFTSPFRASSGLDSDAGQATGRTADISLNWGQSDMTIDAGLYRLTGVGDFVWKDSNGNGLQDIKEPGKANVRVDLYKYDAGGQAVLVSYTTTSCDGSYLFKDLIPGTYALAFRPPTGYVFTHSPAGSDSARDSNADVNGLTAPFLLLSGLPDMTIDAGLVLKPSSLGNFVWLDINRNGIQDEDEVGLWGVKVTLYNSCYGSVATKTTDPNGYYLFDNLTPGSYYVKFTLPCGYRFTYTNASGDDTRDSDANRTTGMTQLVTLLAGQENLTIDAGVIAPCISEGDTATIGFWQNKNGRTLIRMLNGDLATWLSNTFPNLYGPAQLGYRLTTGDQVVALFVSFFKVKGQKTYAQILATAIACYATDKDLAGTSAARYGFNVSSLGTGAKIHNVGPYGAAIDGIHNNTWYTVLDLLLKANEVAPFSAAEFNAFNAIFDGINQLGDIR